jgi:predicted regulator of Ras-like GTPase activity (Roadblock/LC7/MglB family)
MPAAHTMPPLPPVAVRSAPRSAPSVTPPRFTSPVEDLTFGYVDDPTQLALRAIFSTEKTMRPQDIVDFSSQFPGIRGSLIITPEGVTRSGRLDDSDEVRHFSEKASVLYEKTSSLITELGLGTEQTFTLRTGRGIMSFFTHGSICLAVLHGEPNFHPGVREKLILVARELAKMLAA